jgi:hemolysin III
MELSMKTTSHQNWLIEQVKGFREPVSGLTHAAGAVLAFFGMLWLVWIARHTPGRATTLAIFGTTMVMVYIASSAMHLYNGSPKTIKRLNQIDHATIYLLIAGTYTPFTYTFLTDWWRWGLLTLIWSLAIIGLILKLGFHVYGHASTAFYVAMGWVALIAVPRYIMTHHYEALWLILAGGVVYTIGAIIFAVRRPNLHKHFGYHEIWHLFVLGGSACHFLAAALYVA